MTYIPGFDFDIFVSYARVDNLTASGGKGWVDEFHERLEIGLAQELGRLGIIKVWRDEFLDGTQLFDETIANRIKGSALFVALTSPGYYKSDYCQNELREFHQDASTDAIGLQVNDRYRVVHLLLRNIPREEWPEIMGRTGGFPFHDAVKSDERGRPLDPNTDEFKEQMNGLIDAIYKMMTAFRGIAAEKISPGPQLVENPETAATSLDAPASVEAVLDPAGPAPEPVLYVADVADTLTTSRRRTISELQRTGIMVCSDVPPPFEAQPHKDAVVDELKKAALSIHLLDQFVGRPIADEPEPAKGYPQTQLELALEHGKSQLIWVPKNLDIEQVEDPSYREFLYNIENGTRTNVQYEFFRGSSAALVQVVQQKLDESKRRNELSESSDGTRVLIDTHLRDYGHALKLGAALSEYGVFPYVVPQEDDPQASFTLYERTLEKVEVLLIVFGQVVEKWVRGRFSTALHLMVTGDYDIKTVFIYLAPPHKSISSDAFHRGVFRADLLNNSSTDQVEPSSLEPLLDHLKDVRGN